MLKIHACPLDRECRSVGAPKRVYVTTKHLGGLSLGSRTIAWLPFLGFLPPSWWGWWFIAYMPPHGRKTGYLRRRFPHLYN